MVFMFNFTSKNRISTSLQRLFLSCIFVVSVITISALNRSTLNAEELKHKTASQYYLDGIYNYVDRNYTTSAEQFEALSKKYPYSQFTHHSLIMEAFTNFVDKEYSKISGIVEVFFRLFPNDEYTPYMMYLHGMSYYMNIKKDERGFNNVEESLQIFNDIITKYPNSKYAKNVEKKIDYLVKRQQLNDLLTGEYYQKNNEYIGAMRRYTGLFEKYKDGLNKEIEERALCRIMNLSKSMQLPKNATKYRLLLQQKYPNSRCLQQS